MTLTYSRTVGLLMLTALLLLLALAACGTLDFSTAVELARRTGCGGGA